MAAGAVECRSLPPGLCLSQKDATWLDQRGAVRGSPEPIVGLFPGVKVGLRWGSRRVVACPHPWFLHPPYASRYPSLLAPVGDWGPLAADGLHIFVLASGVLIAGVPLVGPCFMDGLRLFGPGGERGVEVPVVQYACLERGFDCGHLFDFFMGPPGSNRGGGWAGG